MSWDDIDFDFIKTGMITRGPAEISWAEYLNVFRDALDEKYNLLTRGGGTIFNDLPEFYTGNIRLAGRVGIDNNNEYFEGISAYWGYLRDLWSGSLWYTSEAMTDPFNAEDYRILTGDLEALIGEQAFGVFENGGSNSELHTAECFNAWYTLLSLMQYRRCIAEEVKTPTYQPLQPTIQTCFKDYTDFGTFYGGAGSAYSPAGECINKTNEAQTNAYNVFTADNTMGHDAFTSSGYHIVRQNNMSNELDLTFGNYLFRTNYLQKGGYQEFVWFKTRGDVDMIMDATKGRGTLQQNLARSKHATQGGQVENYGRYTEEYGQVIGNGDHFDIDIKKYLRATDHGQSTGSRYRYSYVGWNDHVPKRVFLPIDGVPCISSPNLAFDQFDQHLFSMSINASTYIDMNNSALDFYIEEE